MDPTLALWVLVAALLHASWNALLKFPGDTLIKLALINLTGAAVTLPLLPWIGPPDSASWPFLLGSVAVHACYNACLALAYRQGDLSMVYPLARGIAPLLIAVGAWIVAGETLSAVSLLGVVVISAGILTLGISGWRQTPLDVLLFAFGTGIAIVGYTLLDGLGARLAGNTLAYVVWLFACNGLPISLIALQFRRRELTAALRQNWLAGVCGGICSIAAYGLVIWAMTQAPMTYVSALRETSVVIAALIGTRLLREPLGTLRLGAAAVVAIGVAALELSP